VLNGTRLVYKVAGLPSDIVITRGMISQLEYVQERVLEYCLGIDKVLFVGGDSIALC